VLGWRGGIAIGGRRTPLELIAPRLDAQLMRIGRRSRAGGVGADEKNLSIVEGS
jgi:hypothetical protein